MKRVTIYKIICDIQDPTVVYVGSTTQTLSERLSHHAARQNRPTKLNKAIRSIGVEHFSIHPIEIVDSADRMYRERFWTDTYKTNVTGYNKRRGAYLTEDEIETARTTNYRNKEVVCHTTGRHFISCSAAARHYSLNCTDVSECCARHLVQVKGLRFRYADMPVSVYQEYWKSHINRNRQIQCVETGELFENVKTAAAHYKVHRCTISRACETGRVFRGLHLRFVQ